MCPTTGPARRASGFEPGVVLAVEPMLTLGDPATELLDDGWTVRTADGTVAAHFEHTVAVTPAGPWVLTAVDGGAARLAALGVPHLAGWPGSWR